MTRWPLIAAATALTLTLTAGLATAEYQGSDLIGNISPESATGGGFADKYPLSSYALDYHVDGPSLTGGVGDPGPMFSQWLAAQTWDVIRLANRTAIDLFAWAHSLDLINGPQGALRPVNRAIRSLHENVLGAWWFLTAITLAGLWAVWKGLAQRRYPELATGLATSVLFVMIAFLFLYQPQQTIGTVSGWTNDLSLAFLAGTSGNHATPGEAKREVSDSLFTAAIYEPWVVLQFGGFKNCTSTTLENENGWPMPVKESAPGPKRCRSTLERGPDGHGGYAPRFLKHPDTSKARDKEYEALKDGEAPNDPQFAGYPIDRADAPAVDIQQAGGAGGRLVLVAAIGLGSLFFCLLLGALSLWIILAQVIALLLVAFTPVMLLLALFPPTHHFFGLWLRKLGLVLVVKAAYSLVLAVLVTVHAALGAATGPMGFLASFGLSTAFFAVVFLNRRKLAAIPATATAGVTHKHYRKAGRALDQATGAVLYPGKALKSGATDWREKRTSVQESATKHRTAHEHAAPTAPAQPEPATAPARPAREPAPTPAVASTNDHGPREEAARVVRPFKQDLEQHRQARPTPPAAPAPVGAAPRPRGPGQRHEGAEPVNGRDPHATEHDRQPDRTPEPPRPLAAAVRQERAQRAAQHLPDQ